MPYLPSSYFVKFSDHDRRAKGVGWGEFQVFRRQNEEPAEGAGRKGINVLGLLNVSGKLPTYPSRKPTLNVVPVLARPPKQNAIF